jgi:hypothetical protein
MQDATAVATDTHGCMVTLLFRKVVTGACQGLRVIDLCSISIRMGKRHEQVSDGIPNVGIQW